MPTSPDVRRVILAHQGQVSAVRRQVDSFALMAWGSLEAYRDADIDRLVKMVLPVSLGAQQRVAALTDAYLAALATAQGYRQSPAGAPAGELTGRALRGVEPEQVYGRTGPTVWMALQGGASLSSAAAQGRSRLLDLLMTDLQLTKTRTVQWRQQRDETVVGYRRITSGTKPCALCVLSSTQRYTRGDLMPIHPGCGCGIAEIRGTNDPGQVLDPDAVDRLHRQVQDEFGTHDRGGRGPIDYRDVAVRQHGEYGPTLTWRRQNFTGPADI